MIEKRKNNCSFVGCFVLFAAFQFSYLLRRAIQVRSLLGDNSFDGQGIYFYTCMYYPTWAWGNTLHEFFLYFLSDFPQSISKGFPRFRIPVCILSVFVTSTVDLQKRSLFNKVSFYSGIKEGRWQKNLACKKKR